tara:strand:- start:33 stop:407 length:375 start_codon:yes stop_codon:yes gene_type:complete
MSYRLLTVFMFLASFALVVFGNLSPNQAAQSQQHSWVGDVPIMADLSVEPALGFAFDSPNGRIVMIFASSRANAADVFRFYNESLATIGWVGGDGEWRRGPETLVISEVSTAAGRLWRLMLRPH